MDIMKAVSHCVFCFFNDTATTEIYTLSLHDALPILHRARVDAVEPCPALARIYGLVQPAVLAPLRPLLLGQVAALAAEARRERPRSGLIVGPPPRSVARPLAHRRLRPLGQLDLGRYTHALAGKLELDRG